MMVDFMHVWCYHHPGERSIHRSGHRDIGMIKVSKKSRACLINKNQPNRSAHHNDPEYGKQHTE